ncbi:MAG: DUF3990 domain-containing protein [Paenibacillaceae bacterium]
MELVFGIIPKIVYHATLLQYIDSIKDRIIIHRTNAKLDLDFGKGFYTTTNYQQALERALFLQETERDQRRGTLKKEHRGIVITFEINSNLLYTLDNDKKKLFLSRDKEWAEYVVFNRIIRNRETAHQYYFTYGSLADGKFVVILCKKYYNDEITIDQLINGYKDGHNVIQGISPYSVGYDQLSFHENEDFVNSALKMQGFNIIDQNLRRWQS